MATIRVRRTSSGELRYHAQVRLRGHAPETKSFRLKTDASRWAKSTEVAIREGRHFAHAEAKRHTVAETIDRYEREVLPRKRPSTQESQRYLLRWWKQRLGPVTLAEVNTPLVVEKRSELLAEPKRQGGQRSNAIANRYLALLSHVLAIAEREWQWIDSNPCRRISKLPESRGRDRWLDDDERDALLEACKSSAEPALYPIVVLALSTGMRKGEISGLKWSDVDFERRRIILKQTKNGRTRSVPLVGHARDVLREWGRTRRIDNLLVFPGRPVPDGARQLDFRHSWVKAVKAAELADFRFHDLRHSAASYLAMTGASQRDIMEICGHLTPTMAARYSHLSERHVDGVVERMNASIFPK